MSCLQSTDAHGDPHLARLIDNSDAVKKLLPTYEEIRRAIPPKCFEKNLPLSLFYLVLDYAILYGLFKFVPYVEEFAGWPGLLLWYYVVGMFGFSLFVVGHDCGKEFGVLINYVIFRARHILGLHLGQRYLRAYSACSVVR
jgi:fatty acid desaturase